MARRTFVTEKLLNLENRIKSLETDISFHKLCLLDLDRKKFNKNDLEKLLNNISDLLKTRTQISPPFKLSEKEEKILRYHNQKKCPICKEVNK